jgi:hypothetical protein
MHERDSIERAKQDAARAIFAMSCDTERACNLFIKHWINLMFREQYDMGRKLEAMILPFFTGNNRKFAEYMLVILRAALMAPDPPRARNATYEQYGQALFESMKSGDDNA